MYTYTVYRRGRCLLSSHRRHVDTPHNSGRCREGRRKEGGGVILQGVYIFKKSRRALQVVSGNKKGKINS